jgi:photosystem II stability/assembly factor-like uncharacterized protein
VARRLFSSAGLVAAVFSGVATAAQWTNIGPEGGVVLAIAADPVTDFVVYAGVENGGVFRGDLSSATFWTAVNTGLGDLNVRALAVSPAGGGVVLAGTNTGIYRTANGGDSWTLASGPPATAIDDIAFDPTNPATVYAVSFESWIGKSTDGGASWQALGGPASSQRPQAVHVDPTNGAIVYVGTIDGGVYKSTNGGSTWTAQNEGLTNLHVSTIAVDPTSPSTVYLGTDNGGPFRSSDGGTTWTAFSTGVSGNDVDDIVVNPAGRALLANSAGVWGTDDAGLTWTRLALITRGNTLSLGPGNPGTLWVGFGQIPQSVGGVLVSPQPGQFEAALDGLNGVTVSAIAADPSNPQNLLACTPVGTFLSADGGGSWFGEVGAALAATLAFDPQVPGVVYQGYAAGVAKSVDGGVEWLPVNGGLPLGSVTRALLVLGGAPGRVLAGTNSGVYRTVDGAASWSAPGTASPAVVYSLARDNASATAVWAGGQDGVYRSTDEGVNWTLAGSPTTTPVFSVLDSSVAPGKTFAGTGTGLLVSTNDGGSWTPVGGGLPAAEMFDLAEDTDRAAIYTGSAAGVFESLDAGASWHPAADGLTNPYVQSLLVLPNGGLLAGTRGGSIFRRVGTTPTVPRDPVEQSDGRGETRPVPPRLP